LARGSGLGLAHDASGSGGGIRLVAPTISGNGLIAVRPLEGRTICSGRPSEGAIRIEAFTHSFSGTRDGPVTYGTPYGLFLPSDRPTRLAVVRVGGQSVASTPTGGFVVPDVTVNSPSPLLFEIEARNVPPGTVVRVQITSENGPDQLIESTPLAGSLALATATASATLPTGFSRGFVRATWVQ
jgi:hypothetical protein